MQYVCDACGWIYDESAGDPEFDLEPDVSFNELPDDFTCPCCGAGKEMFSTEE